MGNRLTICAIALVLAGLGCGEGGTGPNGTVATVEVTPSPAAVTVGQSLQLTATPRDAGGSPVNGRSVTWASNNPSLATVSASGLVTGLAPGGPVITATVDGKVGSTQVNVTAGTATQLAILTQPSTGAQSGVPLPQQPRVQLRSAANAPVAQSGVIVTATLGSGTGTLLNAQATTDASGIATFSGLAINGAAGSYTLRFDAPSLTGVTSDPVSLVAGTASRLAIATSPPATAQSGAAFAPQPAIQLQDAGGNPVAQGGVTVSAGIASGPGGATLANASASSSPGGLATFSGLALTGPAGTYTLTFTASGLTPTTSGPIVLGSGSAGSLTITTQPSATAQSGVAFPQQPVVVVRDGGGNPLANQSVTASIASGGGTIGGVTTVTTNGSGTASFPNLSVTGLAGPRTLRFTSGAVSVTSATVSVGAGPASAIAMVTQPSATVQSGVPFPQQPVVRLQDGGGNPVAQAGVVITAGFETGTGSLTGTSATTDASGVATFSGLAITGVAGTYTLRFSSNGLTPAVSGAIALGAGSPARLAVATQPSSAAQSGVALGQPPRIQLEDAAGNPVSQAGVGVTATIATGPGGSSLTNASATTNGSGVATFSGLAITGPVGSYTLAFAATGLTGATSDPISLSAGAAARLVVSTQPSSSAQSGAALAQQPRIQLQDAAGNAVSQSGVLVTASIASGPGGATLANATASTNASGLATFSGLAITGTAGTYTLGFASSGLTGATSAAVNLTAGAATRLTITTQPSGGAVSGSPFAQQPQIQLRDGGGNAVSQAGVTVTAVIATGPGGATLSGASTTTNGSGLATFSSLAITGPDGDYTLRFESTGLTSVTSNTVSVSSAASRLTLEVQPAGTGLSGVPLSQQPVVQIRDNAGNPIGQAGVSVTVSIASGPPGSIGNGNAVTDASGRATFSSLFISGSAGTYTLSFNATGLTSAVSNPVTIAYGQGTYTDLTYCNSPGGNLLMDLYVPSNGFARPLPAAVYIHGGGWTSGDKAIGPLFDEVRNELLSRGYLVFSVNYRLAPTWQWPAQIHDVKCAIRSLRANAALYGLDQARIGTWGHSSGGHLAAMLGVTDASSGFEGSLGYGGFSSRVKGAVPFGGISDLTGGPTHPELNFTGPEVTFTSWPGPSAELTNASPITWASFDDPAFYIVHGNQDTTVLPAQASRLHSFLQSAGANSSLLLVTNGGHSLEDVGGPANPSNSQTVILIANFFDNNVK